MTEENKHYLTVPAFYIETRYSDHILVGKTVKRSDNRLTYTDEDGTIIKMDISSILSSKTLYTIEDLEKYMNKLLDLH